ncbi:GGDEF domain-containing protein [Dactylosporangium sp. CS-047395]|uniref:GGDEF domain-containing protein n=1 Tax=Dactylosporangium sp. CS-047395 TaxID=3239936 RepID=UPI003D93C46F
MNTFRERRSAPALLDAGVAATAAGLLSWAFLDRPGALLVMPAVLLAVIALPRPRLPLPVSPAGPFALVLGALFAPGVLLVQYTRGQTHDVPVVAAASALLFLLVLGRMAVELARQHRIATTDALTGLENRRAFEERLRDLVPGRPAAVVLLDLDRFKRINDAFGHPAGDRVLRTVADTLRTTAGPGVTVARYGGEEFALLIPDADGTRAADLADRVRAAIGAAALDLGDGVLRSVTISAGTALLPTDTAHPDELIPLADRALYAAKRTGRDRVVASATATRDWISVDGASRPPSDTEEWPAPLPRPRRTKLEAA